MKTGHDGDASALNRLMRRVIAEIDDGVRHGHFEYTLSCEVIGQGRRRVVLRAGKHYQFVLPLDECESAGRASRDLRPEGADVSLS